jgi:hypothetical protein
MKPIKQLTWILPCVVAGVLASATSAQGEYTPYTPPTTGNDTASKSKQFCPSKDLLGAEVKDTQGKKLGSVSEIYLNPKNGAALAAIDIGNNRHAIVPVQALNVLPSVGAFRNAQASLNKTKADLESGPIIAGSDWQKLDDASFTKNAYSRYNVQSPSSVGGADLPAGVITGSATNRNSQPRSPLPTPPIEKDEAD